MNRRHIYPALADALTKRGFDSATVEKYGQLWDSISPADRLPCPLCFTYAGKRSAPAESGQAVMLNRDY